MEPIPHKIIQLISEISKYDFRNLRAKFRKKRAIYAIY
ncbi:hypothetical protein ATHSA_1051 [Athalassotoga saccharophila]|nr:hypothetical protein ATHSA_1051 [Athalassotoga saccharophila]